LVFPVTVRQKDLGFQLRGTDSSWVLYNWQTKQIVHPVNERDSNRILEMGVKREDGFSRLMAAVVDDTAVMYNTYAGSWFNKDSSMATANNSGSQGQAQNIKKADSSIAKGGQVPAVVTQPPTVPPGSGGLSQKPANKNADTSLVKSSPGSSKPNPVVPAVVVTRGKKGQIPSQKTSDTAVTRNNIPSTGQPPTANGQQLTANSQPPSAPSTIKKLREVSLKISRKLVFVDIGQNGIRDTVTLFVYFENGDTTGKKSLRAALAKKKSSVTDSVSTNSNSQAKNNTSTIFVAGCGEMATEQDLEWLRSAILRANTEQDKISAASGAFALKCFSVSQVRVLASLFVSDKARYRLMDAARQHISDKDHFRELADMYTDKNFQKKFLALADKRT
jgi:hypothetical protein